MRVRIFEEQGMGFESNPPEGCGKLRGKAWILRAKANCQPEAMRGLDHENLFFCPSGGAVSTRVGHRDDPGYGERVSRPRSTGCSHFFETNRGLYRGGQVG